MKRFFKSLCAILAATLLSLTCFSLVGCEDIKTLNVTVSVYDYDKGAFEEKTIAVKLYRHLADDTVDAIIKYAENGLYNDALFYKFGSNVNYDGNGDYKTTYTSQIMMGDYKYVNGEIVKNDADYVGPIVDKNGNEIAEFEKGGTAGSDLKNVKGAVGLWRTWTANGNYRANNGNSYKTGRATWYMPTTTLSDFNGYFCIFGQIDLDNEKNSTAFNLISAVLNSSDYSTSYTVYYTGEYGTNGEGLTYHCILTEDYTDEIKETAFEAKNNQQVIYNATEIKVPLAEISGEMQITAKIVSVKLA